MLALWGLLGLVPWCLAVVARRATLPFAALPLAAVAGMAGGLLVPALGVKGEAGLLLSLIAAPVAGVVVVAYAAKRFAPE
jgi:hypothetical protein